MEEIMKLTEMDQKVLQDLGLDQLPDDQKQKTLKRLDEVLINRFMAKILTSLSEDKQKELEQKVKDVGEDNNEKVFEEAINLHPDAKKVLEESAKEVIEEFKKNQKGADRDTAIKGNEPKLSELKPKPLGEPESPTLTGNPPPPSPDNSLDSQPPIPNKSSNTQQPIPNQPRAHRPTPDNAGSSGQADYYQAG